MKPDAGPDLVGYLTRLQARYGVEPEQFLDLFAAQDHRCAVCRRGLVLFAEDVAEAPVVDHDHQTGLVRGVLCRTCNVAVGYVEKDRVRTKRILGYLKAAAGRNGRGWASRSRQEAKMLDALDASQPAD